MASLIVLQLRDLISIYICHNVGLTKKKTTEELTCFIKLLLHSHNQIGNFIIVILATRHWLTSDTKLVGRILSNSCSQPACFPHQYTLRDLYNHGKWVCIFFDGSRNVTQRTYSYGKWKWDELIDLSKSFGYYKSLVSSSRWEIHRDVSCQIIMVS